MQDTLKLKSEKMQNMPVVKLIFNMSLPAILSMFVLALYNIVDSIFIARYSPKALDALSIVFPMQQLIIAFAVGIAVGTNAYVSRKLGQEKCRSHVNGTDWLVYGINGRCAFLYFRFNFSTTFRQRVY